MQTRRNVMSSHCLMSSYIFDFRHTQTYRQNNSLNLLEQRKTICIFQNSFLQKLCVPISVELFSPLFIFAYYKITSDFYISKEHVVNGSTLDVPLVSLRSLG